VQKGKNKRNALISRGAWNGTGTGDLFSERRREKGKGEVAGDKPQTRKG